MSRFCHQPTGRKRQLCDGFVTILSHSAGGCPVLEKAAANDHLRHPGTLSRCAEGCEEAVLGDVVVDDCIDFGLAGFGESLNGGEGFDRQALGFLKAGGGEFVGFFRVAGGAGP